MNMKTIIKNYVNKCFKMPKCIALKFWDKFSYKDIIKSQLKQISEIANLKIIEKLDSIP